MQDFIVLQVREVVLEKLFRKSPINRRFATLRLYLFIRIKNYLTVRYSLLKALLLYLIKYTMMISLKTFLKTLFEKYKRIVQEL